MRKPCEYVPQAMAKLRGSSLSGCTEVLRHGERAATVTRVGQSQRGGDGVTEAEVAENSRVLAFVADFPDLKIGEAVELGTTLRVVTSCTTGPINTLLTIGLSAAFENCPAMYTGARRIDGRVRNIQHTLDVLALETQSGDSAYEAAAPVFVESWIVAIRREDWPETTDPQVADSISASPCGQSAISLKVAAVTRHEGWYILKCRQRGGA